MLSYFVRYDGGARDLGAFHAHYRDVHAPILADFPGIRGLTLHLPVPFSDSQSINAGRSFLLAQMRFDDAEALRLALASEARARARADMARFPPYDGSVTHQAMRSEEIF